MSISNLVSKIIFFKYLTPVRHKFVSKLKILRIYFKHADPNFDVKVDPKNKSAQNLLKFGTFDISNMPISTLMSKIIFMKYLPPATLKFVLKSNMFRIFERRSA